MPAKPKNIDDYLSRVPADRRRALERLRATILSLLPEVEECISYSMPAFRHEGEVVAGFLATSEGCSYFPFSGRTLGTLAVEVRSYDQTKGSLHFDHERPLPKALVKKLLQARIAETRAAPPRRPARRPAKPSASANGRRRAAGRPRA
jgi:uncharacterized protein YdhG (YjbR/CyaY superfamily)